MNEENLESLQGKVIDDFEILDEVGRGASSRVHLALHKKTLNYVAAKIINLKIQTKYSFELITREISVFMQVSHPNIAKLFRLSKYGDYLIFFMEFATNGTLYSYVMNNRGISEMEANRIFCQLFSVFYYIQTHHFLVHRDIKLENILLDAQNNVKVIDFGLSDTYYRKVMKIAVGTPGYTAPEMLTGNEYNEKCDVWSLGITLYAALTGEMPFSVQHKDPRKLFNEALKLQKLSGITPELQDLLDQMLQPRPQNRPSFMQLIRHPWIRRGGVVPYKNVLPRTIVFYDVPKFDDILKFKRKPEKPIQEIVNQCVALGFNTEEILDGLENGEIDDATTTYFLLQKPMMDKPYIKSTLPPLKKGKNKPKDKGLKRLYKYNTQAHVNYRQLKKPKMGHRSPSRPLFT